MARHPQELIPTRWTLIRRLKDWEDEASWREFFDTYWKLIYGVAVKSGLSPAEAQEVVQETVVSVCKQIGQFEANPRRGTFKGWLMNMTRWRIVDQARKRKPDLAGQRPRELRPVDPEDDTTATEDRIPDPAGNALEAVWEEEWRQNLVDNALESLASRIQAKHYQVFYLTYIRNHAPQRVANAVGVHVDQVYVINHRILPQFRRILERLEAEAG